MPHAYQTSEQVYAVFGELWSPSDDTADVEMRLETETAHTFWLGRASLPLLIAQGKIRVRGSSSQMLRIPRLLKPGYALYPEICRAHGIPTEAM